MALSTFTCECGNSTTQTFTPGKLPEVICEKCGKKMLKKFGKVEEGTVLPKNVSAAGQAILWSDSSLSKKGKLVH